MIRRNEGTVSFPFQLGKHRHNFFFEILGKEITISEIVISKIWP